MMWMPLELTNQIGEYTEEVSPDTISATMQGVRVQKHDDSGWVASLDIISSDTEEEVLISPVKPITASEVKESQRNDSVISRVLSYVEWGEGRQRMNGQVSQKKPWHCFGISHILR